MLPPCDLPCSWTWQCMQQQPAARHCRAAARMQSCRWVHLGLLSTLRSMQRAAPADRLLSPLLPGRPQQAALPLPCRVLVVKDVPRETPEEELKGIFQVGPCGF